MPDPLWHNALPGLRSYRRRLIGAAHAKRTSMYLAILAIVWSVALASYLMSWLLNGFGMLGTGLTIFLVATDAPTASKLNPSCCVATTSFTLTELPLFNSIKEI